MQTIASTATSPVPFGGATATGPAGFGLGRTGGAGSAQAASIFDLLMNLGGEGESQGGLEQLFQMKSEGSVATDSGIFGNALKKADAKSQGSDAAEAAAPIASDLIALLALLRGAAQGAVPTSVQAQTTQADAGKAKAVSADLPAAARAVAEQIEARLASGSARAADAGDAAGKTGATEATAQVWDLKTLSHQLRAALAQVVTRAEATQIAQPGQASEAEMAGPAQFEATLARLKADAARIAQTGKATGAEKASPRAKGAGAEAATGRNVLPTQGPLSAEPSAKGSDSSATAPATSGMATLEAVATEKDRPRGDALTSSRHAAAPLAHQPAAPSGAPASTPLQSVNTASAIDQVQRVTEMLAGRVDGSIRLEGQHLQAHLRLTPQDLGGVQVNLAVQHDASVRATLTADRPETAQLIQQNVGQLQAGLERQGLTVDRIQVVVASNATNAGGGAIAAPAASASSFAGQNSTGGQTGGHEGHGQQSPTGDQAGGNAHQREQARRQARQFFDGAFS